MNIFVGSLSFKTTEERLQKEFAAFGDVDSVKIIIDRETLKSRGFAFVTMPNQEEATAAIAAMNGKEIDGFTLKVNEAKPREPRAPGQRSGGYGRSERSYSSPSSGGYGGGGGGGNRYGGGFDRDSNIYDTKDGRSGGYGNRKGRDGGGRGGRSGGGRRSY